VTAPDASVGPFLASLTLARDDGWALSPDGLWLATFASGLPSRVHVLEVSTGREVLSIPGSPVSGLHWAGPEVLWVLRQQPPNDLRVVAHAVPDGGVVETLGLPNARAHRCRVTASADGALALVAPVQWPSEHRGARLRLGALLRGPVPELVRPLDPHELRGVPASPVRRAVVASLGPDGQRVALVYGSTRERSDVPPTARGDGALVFYDWRRDKVTVTAVRPLGEPSGLLWCSAGEVAWLAHTPDASPRLLVAEEDRVWDLSGGLRDAVTLDGGDALQLHPDRETLLVSATETLDGRARRGFVVALRSVGGVPGVREGAFWSTGARPAFGAVCAAADGALWSVDARRPKALCVRRQEDEGWVLVRELDLPAATPRRGGLRVLPGGRRALLWWEIPGPAREAPSTVLAIVDLRG
jgi:hypothetical protein